MLTVGTPNTDRSLLSIAELRAAAGLAVGDASRDTELQTLGDYTAAVITAECNVARSGAIPPTLRLEHVVETFRYPTPRAGAVSLVRWPVVSITSVTEATSALGLGDYEVDESQLFRVSSGDRIRWGIGTIVVAYDAGWQVVPADLKYAATKFVQDELSRGSRDRYLRARIVPGVLEQQWWVDPTKDSMIPPEVRDMLEAGGYIRRWGWMS